MEEDDDGIGAMGDGLVGNGGRGMGVDAIATALGQEAAVLGGELGGGQRQVKPYKFPRRYSYESATPTELPQILCATGIQ